MRKAADLKCIYSLQACICSVQKHKMLEFDFSIFWFLLSGWKLCFRCLGILERTFQRIPYWWVTGRTPDMPWCEYFRPYRDQPLRLLLLPVQEQLWKDKVKWREVESDLSSTIYWTLWNITPANKDEHNGQEKAFDILALQAVRLSLHLLLLLVFPTDLQNGNNIRGRCGSVRSLGLKLLFGLTLAFSFKSTNSTSSSSAVGAFRFYGSWFWRGYGRSCQKCWSSFSFSSLFEMGMREAGTSSEVLVKTSVELELRHLQGLLSTNSLHLFIFLE